VIFTTSLGKTVDVDPNTIERELSAVVTAVSAACGASSTAPELENLRRARQTFLKALDRVAVEVQ
jgi:hypothetical protein